MGNEDPATLKASLRGALIGRDDADYDEARKLYNGMIDKRPLMIARCAESDLSSDQPIAHSMCSPSLPWMNVAV